MSSDTEARGYFTDPGPVPATTDPATEPAARTADQLAERTGDLQRLQAEYVNYKRRAERDRDRVIAQAAKSFFEPLLGILDDIDRAARHDELVGGFKAVADRLTHELTAMGLQRFGEPGDPFDPAWHAAIVHLPTEGVTEPTCLDIVTPGYTRHGQLVRVAQVAVSTPPG